MLLIPISVGLLQFGQGISTPLIFLLVLSILILVHEAGHFLMAKYLKIKVEEFAFGLPLTRPLFSFKKGETQYAIYPALVGGFVRMHGEESAATSEKQRSFWDRNKKQRLLVIVAGVVMNLVLALVGFIILYSVIGVPHGTINQVTFVDVAAGSPAAKAGLVIGDRVLAVEGRAVHSETEFSQIIKSWAGLPVNLTIAHGTGTPLFEGVLVQHSTTSTVQAIPRVNPPPGQGALGVQITDYPYLVTDQCAVLSLKCKIDAVGQGIKTTGLWIGRVFDGFRSIGQSLAHGQAPQGVSGPIGIYQLTDIVAKEGVWPIVELICILSVNLAVFNILPIPALDGGRAFFIVLEAIRRKRVSAELEQKVNSVGMAILLTLLALITLQDVLHLDFVRHLFGK